MNIIKYKSFFFFVIFSVKDYKNINQFIIDFLLYYDVALKQILIIMMSHFIFSHYKSPIICVILRKSSNNSEFLIHQTWQEKTLF